MRKWLPTFCTWKIYTAPQKETGGTEMKKKLKRGK